MVFCRKTSLLVLGVIMGLVCTAQNNEKLVKKYQSLAEEYYRIEEYHHALPNFLLVDSLSPNDGNNDYRIGVCYLHSTHKKKALPYLQKALKEGGAPDEIYYYLGVCNHMNHNLDEAVEDFKVAKQKLPNYSDVIKVTAAEIDREIASCEFAKQQIAHPLDYEITHLGDNINSAEPDYSPVVSADEEILIFTSRRHNSMGKMDYHDDLPYEDLYISRKDGNGNWTMAKNMGDKVNTKYHDASVGISPDGQSLFIYRSDLDGSSEHESGNIFLSKWDGNDWTIPEKLAEPINTEYWEPSATIMSHENIMFFSSNRPGGKGKKDIYMSKRLPNGQWGEPISLDVINTEFDDDAPFIHSDDRTLYFSSKGHTSMGGYDIFMSIMDNEGNWTEPQNLGYPVNTTDDDIFFSWAGDGKNGFLSSIRDDSKGDKDIYMVKRLVETKSFMVLKGTVLDAETKEPLSATIEVRDMTDKLSGFFTSKPSSGQFVSIIPESQNFKLVVKSDGYEMLEEGLTTPSTTEFMEMEKVIYLTKAKVEDTTAVASGDDFPTGGQMAINDIYFDFDKSNVKKDGVAELGKVVKIMVAYPDLALQLRVIGHTDSKGSDAYNLQLSKRRAQAAIDYLVSKGVERERLILEYKGESNPIAPNAKPDGSDNPEGRALNRRTEFRFVDKTK